MWISCFNQDQERVPLWITGAVAQLGERLLCKQEVVGSSPSSSISAVRRESPGWLQPGRPDQG